MKRKSKESNEDIFNSFLIKEKELEYVEKNHAQACIMQMSKDYQEYENQATTFSKIKDFVYDILEYCKLKREQNKNIKKINGLKEEEKQDKILDHKIYQHNDFKTHIFLEKKFREKNIIADCGGFHYPVIEYEVYIRIEYSIAEIWTKKHLKDVFSSYEEATVYFSNLNKKYKTKDGKSILNYLSEKIDNHCKELNKRISSFN